MQPLWTFSQQVAAYVQWLSTTKCELNDSRETPVWQFYQIPNNQLDFIVQVVLNMVQSFVRTILVEGENILGSNWNASIQIKRAESCDPVMIQPSEPNLAFADLEFTWRGVNFWDFVMN